MNDEKETHQIIADLRVDLKLKNDELQSEKEVYKALLVKLKSIEYTGYTRYNKWCPVCGTSERDKTHAKRCWLGKVCKQ